MPVCSWLTSVEWAKWGSGKKIWDAAMSEVHAPQPVKAPLPSDSRHRGDLKALVVRLMNSCCSLPCIFSTVLLHLGDLSDKSRM